MIGININFQSFIMQPFLTANSFSLFSEAYKEKGADSLDLKVERKTYSLIRTELGLQFTKEWKFQKNNFTSALRGGWVRDTPISKRSCRSKMNGYSQVLVVKGYNQLKDKVNLGVDFVVANVNGINTIFQYDIDFKKHYQAHRILGKLEWNF